jgi:predicted metalloprotease with PDZ domain
MPVAVDQLFTEIHTRFGLRFSPSAPNARSLCWSADMEAEYEMFSHVTPGTPIIVVRAPVRNGDTVIKKGLVQEDFGSAR